MLNLICFVILKCIFNKHLLPLILSFALMKRDLKYFKAKKKNKAKFCSKFFWQLLPFQIKMNLDISEDLDFDLTLPNDARSTRDMETIDLSSDEDEMITEDDDIAIVTVRPKSKSRLLDPLEEEVTIQEMDPLNESTQIIKVIRDKYNMNMEEKSGYVKVSHKKNEGFELVFFNLS